MIIQKDYITIFPEKKHIIKQYIERISPHFPKNYVEHLIWVYIYISLKCDLETT